jgi:OOP family OmpA-OmpF porin
MPFYGVKSEEKMATADNLLSMTQSFMTPDLVQRFSGALGQPADKIQSGLKSVIPSFLMGLANKGSTNEGAQSILNMARNPNLEGSEAVNGIFGNELTSVSTSLGSATGMSSSSITKMLSMIAPVVMGVLNKKVRQEGMNASGLMGFLSNQKASLANLVPVGISNLFGFGASSPSMGKVASSMKDVPHSAKSFPTTRSTTLPATTKKSWAPIILLAAAILAALWWFSSGRRQMTIPTTTTTETTMNTELRTPIGLVKPAAELSGLGAFLKSADANELPKRFAFQNLNFETDSAILAQSSAAELDYVATIMREHPRATARIEGFSDNSGDMAINSSLSASRAETIKQELVARKVESGRLETAGRGSESPIAENTSDAGRADNRRIEFVVTGL